MTEIEEIERQRPGDVARAKSLLRRSDALHNAIIAVEDAEWGPEVQEETLDTLRVMYEEVNREFRRARRELGIPDPTS